MAAAVVVGLVIFVTWGESQGWPFLVEPLQRRLSTAMHRDVSFSPDGSTEAHARIHLLGGVRVDAPRIRIAAPDWSAEPHMLLATDASIHLGYADLWRAYRGGPLHIRSIKAEQIDLAVERLADGRASWQFRNEPGAPAGPPPTIGHLEVADGAARYRDLVLDAAVDAHFTLIDSSGRPAVASGYAAASSSASASAPARAASAAQGLRVVANGKYRSFPLKVQLETSGILPLVGEQAAKLAVPVALTATIGRARLDFHGTATDAIHLGALTGVFTLAGPSLAAVGDPLGVTLPSTPAFRTEGRIAQRGNVWNAVFDSARIGTSRLSGAFTYDLGPAVPLLSGRLGGSRLLLADLGPAIGASAPGSAASGATGAEAKPRTTKVARRVLPDREFDLPALRVMDANVAVDIAEVDLGTQYLEPLRPLRAHLQLSDAVLRLTDIDARTGQGRLSGSVQLDGHERRAVWTTALRVADVRLERWIRQTSTNGGPPYVSGRLRGVANLHGEGRSTAQILGTLKGNVGFQLQGGKISHLAVEAAGVDIAQGLGLLIVGDKPLDVQCGVADLQAQAGILRPRAFILDTSDSTIAVDGSVSMLDETMDLRAVVSPKDFSPLALRTPVRVRGPLDAPQVSLEKGPLARHVGAAALLALITPIAALLPLIDTGDQDGAAQALADGCRALVKRSGATAAKAAPAPASSPARAAARRR
ncbi:MAG: AsmA family protein [Burkholderiaceae bacterium]